MSVATFAAAQVLRVLPRTSVSRAVGRLCEAPLPPRLSSTLVGLYVRAYGVDLAECEARGAWTSLDEFFTRPLRPGARASSADASHVVSPADGRVEAIGAIDAHGSLRVKSRPYRAAELLGSEREAERYAGGQVAVVYLSPRDYHRVHAPIAGRIAEVRSMPGDLHPVNAIGERHVPGLFAKNRRVAIAIDGGALGRVTVVMVGAIIVGRITVTGVDGRDVPIGEHRLDPPREVARGDEIGVFHLGSTAIVFAEPGRGPLWQRGVGPIRLGQSLVGDA